MTTLESQVAKIQIGNFKQTTSYVQTFAEKASAPDCELYAVVELPLFNPAAIPDCERISQALLAALKRAYKRGISETTFELALAEINEELGKLAALGQTNWIGKLNSVVAVKFGDLFNIATTGKVTAILFREEEVSDITDSPKTRHPLKTFENFATGKLKAGDVLALSTAELFNHISIDRLTNIIQSNSLGLAAEAIVKILEDNAGPEVAFGTLLMYENVPTARVDDEVINLEEYLPPNNSVKALLRLSGKKLVTLFAHHKIKASGKKLLEYGKGLAKKKQSINITDMAARTKMSLRVIGSGSKLFNNQYFQKFSNLPRVKKFFIISAAVLAIVVLLNIILAKGFRGDEKTSSNASAILPTLERLLQDADSSLLYNNENGARELLVQFTEQSKSIGTLTETQEQQMSGLRRQAEELKQKLEKTSSLSIVNLGSLSDAENLIVLPNIYATATGNNIISFNTATNTITDGNLKSPTTIIASSYISDNNAVVYDGQSLSVWNFATGSITIPTYLNVPAANSISGLAFYKPNDKIYIIDTAKQQIISFLANETGISKPTTWNKPIPELADSLDMAIDGDIYILHKTTVRKYSKGLPVAFNFPELSTPLSGKGKIFTNKDAKNIYVLDSGNKRIIIINKKAELVKILEHPELTNPSDFSIDESTNTIYILNNGSLLKATY